MLKFLIILAFLTISPFLLTNASSLEVEFQKESERIIDSMGWLEPEKISYQEQIQILVNHDNSQNKISVSMLSKDPNDIRLPDYIEDIVDDPKIISFILTNEFACAPNNTERACVIIDVERAGLGNNIPEIRENTRAVTEKIVGAGVILFAAEFDSVMLHQKTNLDGSEEFVSRATYTINKQTSDELFNAFAKTILSSDIVTSAGFYVHAEELTRNYFLFLN